MPEQVLIYVREEIPSDGFCKSRQCILVDLHQKINGLFAH